MAVKRAIFEVDVKGAEKVTGIFNKMRAIQEGAAKSAVGVGLTEGTKKAIGAVKELGAQTDALANKSRAVAGFWRQTAEYTGKVAGSLYSGLNTLLRWSGIGGLAAGLATGGSIWGLERFASAANSGRRSATGLGLPYGKQAAFGLAYQRLIDSQGFLGGISTARGNISSGAATALNILGMDPQGKGDTGDIANEALKRIRELAKNTPEGELGFLPQTHHLSDLGIDIEQLRRLKFGSDDEFSEFQKNFGVRSKQLDVSDSILLRWQNLNVQLEATAEKLKNSFLTSLEKLTTPLEKLSEAFGNAVASLAGSKGFQEILDKVAKGMTVFADYMGSQKFQDDVKLFAESIEMLAQKTVSALRWLGLIPDPNAPAKDMNFGESNKKVIDTQNRLLDWLNRNNPWASKPPGYSAFYGQAIQSQLSGTNLEPDALLRLVGQIESGNNPNAPRGGSGEYGQYQIMPATGAQYGFSESLLDTKSGNRQAAQAILSDLAKRYNNNLQDILVGYNGGPGAADAWIKSGRDMSKLDPKIQNYLAKANQAMVTININNNTGGNAVVGVGQLGIPGLNGLPP